MPEKFLARHTTATLYTLLQGKKAVVALVPIGSTEPHGPHLGLGRGHRRAHGQELGLDGDAPLARLEVAGDDRVGRDHSGILTPLRPALRFVSEMATTLS